MVDEADLEAVLVLVWKENGHLQQMTSDYAARILHPGTVKSTEAVTVMRDNSIFLGPT